MTASPLWFNVLLLTSISCISINNFFAYHAVAGIANEFCQAFALNTIQFGLLFTLYSAPNVVLVFFTGLLIDRYGPERTSLLFSSLMLLGMVVFALPTLTSPDSIEDQHASWWHSLHPSQSPLPYFYTGRLLLGFGESLCAAVAAILAQWYKARALTFALGINQSVVQLFGSAAAFYLLPRMNVVQALWVTVAVCCFSLCANLVYFALHHYFPQYKPKAQEYTSFDESEWRKDGDGGQAMKRLLSDDLDGQEQMSPFLTEEDIENSENDLTRASISPPTPSLLKELPVLFWLITLMIAFLSPVLYTYTAFSTLQFMQRFSLSAAEMGSVTSVLYVTLIFSPLSGILLDMWGYKAEVQACATFFIPLFYAVLAFTNLTPWFGMTALGLVYSVTENLGYSLVASAVPNHRVGVAYGIVSCMVSIALLFEPAGVGFVKEATGSYFVSNFCFVIIGFLGWVCAVGMLRWDRTHEKLISGPTSAYSDLEDEINNEQDDYEYQSRALEKHGIVKVMEVMDDVDVMRKPFVFNIAHRPHHHSSEHIKDRRSSASSVDDTEIW